MQFIASGPDVPDRLIEDHEDGKVVFFCGAGISYPAGLPGFKDLTQRTYKGLGMGYNEVAKAAMGSGHYDMALSLLERDHLGGRQMVRQQIAHELKPNFSLPGATATHEALLTLAKSRAGQTRLVTTNFDRIFETLKPDRFNFHAYSAPLLPVPKKRWDGLVYLHGLLPETLIKPTDLDCLVVTSGDFGLSYLTERWAARFVSELFRNYTVCFVGYSIDDPVLRYMMDALASDRSLGETPPEAFAFAGYNKGQEVATQAEWRAKNVTPILYWQNNRHDFLHRSLQAWASTYRDGVLGKENIVASYALAKPTGSTEEDDYVGRLIWALSDKSGGPAQLFAKFDPLPTFDWLAKFEEKRFKAADLVRFDIIPSPTQNGELLFSLMDRPAPYHLTPNMRPSHPIDRYVSQIDRAMAGLVNWLSRHVANPNLLLWVCKRGAGLSHHFRQQILSELTRLDLPDDLVNAWRLVLTGRIKRDADEWDLFRWKEMVQKAGLTVATVQELRRVLEPKVRFSETYRRSPEASPVSGIQNLEDVVQWEVCLKAGHVWSAFAEVQNLPAWQAQHHLYWADFTNLLRDVFDLKSTLGDATPHHDKSYAARPSIEAHGQNNDHRDWPLLVDLVRDAWLVLGKENPQTARSAVGYWQTIRYPIFRRLTFFAMSASNLFTPDEQLDAFLEDDNRWLWTSETKRESFQLLKAIASKATGAAAARLEVAILSGPPKSIFREGLTEQQIAHYSQEDIWQRLFKSAEAGLTLSTEAAARLAEMQEVGNERQPDLGETGEFTNWSGFGRSPRQVVNAPTDLNELIKWLQAPRPDNWLYSDDWQDRCKADYASSAVALIKLAGENIWPVDRWREALMAWSSDSELVLKSWLDVSLIILEMSDTVFGELSGPVAWWLDIVAKSRKELDLDRFFAIANRILVISKLEVVAPDDDIVFRAINSSVGQVTQGLMNMWFSKPLKDGEGLANPFRSVFSLIADTDISAFRYGRVLLTANMIALYRVDPEWTVDHLVPLFDWTLDEEEARSAWKGYLWSARLHPSLDLELKPFLLQTTERLEQLNDTTYTFIQLFVYLCLLGTKGFSRSFQKKALSNFSQEQLEDAARALAWAHKSAGDQKAEYWFNRVRAFIQFVWPKSVDHKSQGIAHNFARICVEAKDAFPDALRELLPWLDRRLGDWQTLHELRDSNLSATFPLDSLTYMDRIVPDRLASGQDELQVCLSQIRAAAPHLANEPRLMRLEQIARMG